MSGDKRVLASGLGLTVTLAPLLIVIGVVWLLGVGCAARVLINSAIQGTAWTTAAY